MVSILNNTSSKNVAGILSHVVGPFRDHCSASGMQPADAYVTAPLIGLGIAPLHASLSGSHVLDRIVAFDRAEAETANLTQTNLVAVSSFNGPRGLLWGYDLLPQPVQPHPLLSAKDFPCACDAQPLLDATLALLGTVRQPRFPVLPGQHLLCAYKTLCLEGPAILYGALAIAIAADRERNADLFLEDHGTIQVTEEGEAGQDTQKREVLRHLVDATRRIGDNLDVQYEKVFLAIRTGFVPEGHIGCALTAAPYIHLAKNAVPPQGAEALQTLSVPEWEQSVCLHPKPPPEYLQIIIP